MPIPLWVTVHKSPEGKKNKLDGLISISTARELNKFCKNRMQDPDSICSMCYVPRFVWRKNLRKWLEFNYKALHIEHTPDWVEEIDFKLSQTTSNYARIESFGDVDCLLQCCNYLEVVRYMKRKTWVAWTKNLGPWIRALEKTGKPSNFILGYSSSKFNEQAEVPEYAKPYVDFVFTVYTKDYLKDHPEVVINCGGKQCKDCGLCYQKHAGGLMHINEIIK